MMMIVMMMMMLTVIWDILGLRDDLSDLSRAYQRLPHRIHSTQKMERFGRHDMT
jgi:hypothetical protein